MAALSPKFSKAKSQNARTIHTLKLICAVRMQKVIMTTRSVLGSILGRLSGRASARLGAALVFGLTTFAIATPALAHHPFGGTAPQTLFAGLVSGIGHPVLGFDHLAFTIAVGLVASVLRRGITVPLAFLLAALTGTGLHLAGANLPIPELVISFSVLLFGLLAVTRRDLSTQAVVALTALAGVFHGYAYGEAVVGAESTPLVAYLVGFTLVQGAIAGTAYLLSQRAISKNQTVGILSIRQAGFAVCGAGAILLGNLFV